MIVIVIVVVIVLVIVIVIMIVIVIVVAVTVIGRRALPPEGLKVIRSDPSDLRTAVSNVARVQSGPPNFCRGVVASRRKSPVERSDYPGGPSAATGRHRQQC